MASLDMRPVAYLIFLLHICDTHGVGAQMEQVLNHLQAAGVFRQLAAGAAWVHAALTALGSTKPFSMTISKSKIMTRTHAADLDPLMVVS
jgi:hypothetical protein